MWTHFTLAMYLWMRCVCVCGSGVFGGEIFCVNVVWGQRYKRRQNWEKPPSLVRAQVALSLSLPQYTVVAAGILQCAG
ncbi:hypothetical protein SK128_007719 [Halocaridina rubra]|uniref:Secreted protein n=1 Tax=Halocaridina rubra TaxID=373956 RepID=A0AAN8XCF9_HALRR